jgi:hypothetical protein
MLSWGCCHWRFDFIARGFAAITRLKCERPGRRLCLLGLILMKQRQELLL